MSINIKPSKKGSFTKAAKERGKSVQQLASQVLAHKDSYSPAMVKKANFARNATHFNHGKADAGTQLPGGDPQPFHPLDIPSSLDQMIQWTTLQHNLFPISDVQVDYNQNPNPPAHDWDGYQKAAQDYYKGVPQAATQKQPSSINWGSVINGGLTALDSFIPEPKNQPKVNRPLSYNPKPQGYGSQALYADGGTVDSGDPTPQVKKYGDYVSGREAWLNWANKPLLGGNFKDITTKAAQAEKLNPALLGASSLEEGVNQRIKSPDTVSEAYVNANKKGQLKDYAVDGFYNYGLDTFGDNYDTLVKKGYLTSDFKSNFIPYQAQNEKHQKINTAAFRDDASAMQAKAAMLAYNRDQFNQYAQKKQVQLSPEAQDFFTLATYNGGIGNSQKMLDYYNQQGLLKDNAFLTKKPKLYAGIYDNVMHRMQGAQMLSGEHVFKNGGEVKADSLPTYYDEGSAHDLDEGSIKNLLDQGYELSYV
jgi:hypothetical protein